MEGSRSNLPLGAAQMVLAALFFALMAGLVQMASERLPGPMVVFGRNLVALVFVLPFAVREGWAGLRTRRLSEHVMRTVVGLAAMYCFFGAIARLRLADAVLLQYTLPLFLPLVEATWNKQPIPHRVWGPLLLGFAGVILVLKPGPGMFQAAALIGLAAGLLSAIAQTGIRRMTSTESTIRIIFYFSLFSTLVSAGPAAATWAPAAPTALMLVVGAGAVGTAAQVLMTRAYACAPAAQVGAFIYASVPFAMLFDWLRLGRVPDWTSAAGSLLIAGAGVVMLRVARLAAVPLPPADRWFGLGGCGRGCGSRRGTGLPCQLQPLQQQTELDLHVREVVAVQALVVLERHPRHEPQQLARALGADDDGPEPGSLQQVHRHLGFARYVVLALELLATLGPVVRDAAMFGQLQGGVLGQHVGGLDGRWLLGQRLFGRLGPGEDAHLDVRLRVLVQGVFRRTDALADDGRAVAPDAHQGGFAVLLGHGLHLPEVRMAERVVGRDQSLLLGRAAEGAKSQHQGHQARQPGDHGELLHGR